MRLIAFITEGTQTDKILDHIGVDSEPPHIAPARGPPLWDECSDAQMDDGAAARASDPNPSFAQWARFYVSGNAETASLKGACSRQLPL